MVTASAQTKCHVDHPLAETSFIGVSGIKLFVTAPPTKKNLNFMLSQMWQPHLNASLSASDLCLLEDVAITIILPPDMIVITPSLLHWVYSPVNSTVVAFNALNSRSEGLQMLLDNNVVERVEQSLLQCVEGQGSGDLTEWYEEVHEFLIESINIYHPLMGERKWENPMTKYIVNLKSVIKGVQKAHLLRKQIFVQKKKTL